MGATTPATHQLEVRLKAPAATVCGALRGSRSSALLLEGAADGGDGWTVGPLVALAPECHAWEPRRAAEGLAELQRLVTTRRATGGAPETGVAALLPYELLDGAARPGDGAPGLVVAVVDRSLRSLGDGTVRLTARGPLADRDADRALEQVERALGAPRALEPVRLTDRPRTSLPREAYLTAVAGVLEHIGRGDIYQANLCQRFEVGFAGDPFEAYVRLSRATPAPRAAYFETPNLALASVSPETFLLGAGDGFVETWPIKGTRPRGATAEEDSALARALRRSEKDQAEMLMIVDLERNDLSRVCLPGSVDVPQLAALCSYPAVHHLVSRVRGRLRPGVGLTELVRATFPGGSISGAPKIRAMEILRALEPVPRGLFTGSLCWFGDDGTLDSSILIRSWVFGRERAWLGAGGGIVADSDPRQEWQESNHKARALARVVGFEPEEAA